MGQRAIRALVYCYTTENRNQHFRAQLVRGVFTVCPRLKNIQTRTCRASLANNLFFFQRKDPIDPVTRVRSLQPRRADQRRSKPVALHVWRPVFFTSRRTRAVPTTTAHTTMSAGDMNDFHQILTSLLSTDNNVRQTAEVKPTRRGELDDDGRCDTAGSNCRPLGCVVCTRDSPCYVCLCPR